MGIKTIMKNKREKKNLFQNSERKGNLINGALCQNGDKHMALYL